MKVLHCYTYIHSHTRIWGNNCQLNFGSIIIEQQKLKYIYLNLAFNLIRKTEIALKMPIKRKERENSNETTCVKSYRMDHMPTDHELFLQAFESKSLTTRFHNYFVRICTLECTHTLIDPICLRFIL